MASAASPAPGPCWRGLASVRRPRPGRGQAPPPRDPPRRQRSIRRWARMSRRPQASTSVDRHTIVQMIGDGPLTHFPPGYQNGAPPILGAIAPGVGICIAQTSGPQRYGRFTSRDDLGRCEGFRERAAVQNRDCRENKTSCRHRLIPSLADNDP